MHSVSFGAQHLYEPELERFVHDNVEPARGECSRVDLDSFVQIV